MVAFLSLLVYLAVVVGTYYYLAVYQKAESPSSSSSSNGVQKDGPTPHPNQETSNQQPKKQQKQKQPKKKRSPPSGTSHPRFLHKFGGHTSKILSIAVSPNGEWLATSGADSQLRVTRAEKKDFYLRANMPDHEMVHSVAWEADNRTLVCLMERSNEIKFYRMRKRKDAAAAKANFPYELIELAKRHFSTTAKLGHVGALVVDESNEDVSLVLTSGDSTTTNNRSSSSSKTVTAWDGKTGDAISTVTTSGGDVRISRDGKFLCGRGCGGKSAGVEAKLFELIKKKEKGELEPRFQKISPKAVMTLVASSKIVNIAFGYNNHTKTCDKAFVCGVDGVIQVWNLNIEYRLKEDPKLLCSTNMLSGKTITEIETSLDGNRLVIATNDSSLHVFQYTGNDEDNIEPSLKLDFSVENCGHSEGIGDLKLCFSGDILYTRGIASKDVFAWNMKRN